MEKALISCFCLTNFPIVVEEKGVNNNNWAWTTQADKASDMAQELSHLMGEEKCEESDEECMKRRMITESHLDYIYTQSHNKP